MPSLRPMLHSARKVGAFENRDTSKVDAVDPLLQELQRRHQNVCLPGAEEGHSEWSGDSIEERVERHIDAHTSKKSLASEVDDSETCSTRSSNGETLVAKTISTVSQESKASGDVPQEREAPISLGDSIIVGHSGESVVSV